MPHEALLGSAVDTLLSVYGGLGTVSVYSAMLGPQWYMLCGSHGVCRRDPCRGAEAVSHGADCLLDQGDSPVTGLSDR